MVFRQWQHVTGTDARKIVASLQIQKKRSRNQQKNGITHVDHRASFCISYWGGNFMNPVWVSPFMRYTKCSDISLFQYCKTTYHVPTSTSCQSKWWLQVINLQPSARPVHATSIHRWTEAAGPLFSFEIKCILQKGWKKKTVRYLKFSHRLLMLCWPTPFQCKIVQGVRNLKSY